MRSVTAAGTPVREVCWNHSISRWTFRAWKAKYGAAIDSEIDRLKQPELENAHLRRALARELGSRAPAPASCERQQDRLLA